MIQIKEQRIVSLAPLPGSLIEPAGGLGFGMEAVALAWFASLRAGMRVIDLGTGCAIIPLILANRQRDLQLCGVELEAELASFAHRNMRRNGFGDIFKIIHDDVTCLPVRQPVLREKFDLVVSNPPFYDSSHSRQSSQRLKSKMKFASRADMSAWFKTAAFLLRPGGLFCLIMPSIRFSDTWRVLAQLSFQPLRFARIVTSAHKKNRFFLLEAAYRIDPRPLTVHSDIYP